MKIIKTFCLLCLSATSCLAFFQEAIPRHAPSTASLDLLKQKIDRLKKLGLQVSNPGGLHHSEFSRYEAAVAAYAALQEYNRLLADTKRRSNPENRQVLLQAYEDINALIRATPRELKSLGVDLRKTDENLDRIALELKKEGLVVRRFRDQTFLDVPEGHWAASALHELEKIGLLRGYPDGLFRGN